MRTVASYVFMSLLVFILPIACIDPEETTLSSTKTILLVEGTLTNLAEPQIIKLSQAQADRLTGQFTTVPVTKASVDIMVDSSQLITCHETLDGSYQLPGDFRGQVGHAYQLRFTLPDGTRYVSSQQVMPFVAPIDRITARFNPASLSLQQLNGYTAAHDIFIDSQDPGSERNYYRWEWKLWERQYWCHSCRQGVYSKYKVLPNVYRARDYFVTGTELYEDCFSPPAGKAGEEAPEVPKENWIYDYGCQTPCWQLIYGYDILVFDDQFTNGRPIIQQRVAQIPYYDNGPGLVDVRQLSLTADAYRYYKLFQEQTQHTGGLADTPPSALGGNVYQADQPQSRAVGYFSASAISLVHYWLDRKDTKGVSYGATGPVDTTRANGSYGSVSDGLFYALNARQPTLEPSPPYLGERQKAKVRLWPNADRPPLAPCLQSDRQTPFKPEGWKD
ncbi:DUF4249 domain-containing protein [Spirosoma endbachense]|uniref:DUF4249 family protein n=1 Tax=Spirosoma endbachense TaxID=2666025 RepID=A0A6P1VTH2_9BACT|nr:DUF4249 domain-containing protein [Spirosoma endbachense]QHV96531.1 DUF4249 family protein [Spirosoma endbachense]